MSLRTIMIFPEFENIKVIDEMRLKYDPLANLVRPHITLVFPFESNINNAKLELLLIERLKKIKSFEIKLCGYSKQEDQYGYFLFLNVNQGSEELILIHKLLYESELKEFDLGYDYIPHVTVGKFSSKELLEKAYQDVCIQNNVFQTTVNKISVELIGEKDESIIIFEKNLE